MPMGTSGVSFTVNPHNNLQQQSANNNSQNNFFPSHAPPENLNHLHQTNNVWTFNQVQNALITQQQQNFTNSRNLNYATLGNNPNFQTPSSNPGRFSQNNSFAGFRNNQREVYRVSFFEIYLNSKKLLYKVFENIFFNQLLQD